jgi:2-amino-4-hydroxy-6-hydroxymethyldihydropteridine diphosphokinase
VDFNGLWMSSKVTKVSGPCGNGHFGMSFAMGEIPAKSSVISMIPHIAYLSLGSNVGDREAQLRDAIAHLAAVGRVTAVSAFYETEPVAFTEQPWFLNCAVSLETEKTPQQLMASVLGIEEDMGRKRAMKNGPRLIDIDIALFDREIVESKEVTIPHPAMHERRFVLEPLAEIAPMVLHPVLKKTVQQLREELPEGQTVRRLES